jgi:hypothetical protein
MDGRLKIKRIDANFVDLNEQPVALYEASGGTGFRAFVYQCRLNLDFDGAPKAYGYDNPAAKNSAGGPNLQRNLDPLESWHKGWKGVSKADSQKSGLGNACGDPGDGTKGWQNFLSGNRKFYWIGIKALRKADAAGYVLDDRAELEAGLDQNYSDYFNKHNRLPDLAPKGSGYFPVVQSDGDSAGYYISTTSVHADSDASEYSTSYYLDSTKVPYQAWANEWNKWAAAGGLKVKQGDFGIAIRPSTGANAGYAYGDAGTPNKVGECSQKLHEALGISSDLVAFIAFPGSGAGKVLGSNPQDHIRPGALLRSMDLRSDALDLATFLATGTVNLKSPVKMTTPKARLFNNIYAALTDWTNVSEDYPYYPRRRSFGPL